LRKSSSAELIEAGSLILYLPPEKSKSEEDEIEADGEEMGSKLECVSMKWMGLAGAL
jgi:hypothetical protein